MTSLVLTLLGPDRPGLVESVADVIAGNGGNWLESRMAHLAGKFAGVLRAEVPADKVDPVLQALGRLESRGLKIVAEVAGAADEPAGQKAMDLELVGLDRPGIIREVSRVLAARGVNVEELHTQVESAPMSGETLFRMNARVRCPGALRTAELRAALEAIAGELMVDLELGAV